MAAGDRDRDDRNDCRGTAGCGLDVWYENVAMVRAKRRGSLRGNSAPEMKRRRQPSTAAPRGYISSLVKQTN
jgi:hypothetical protein